MARAADDERRRVAAALRMVDAERLDRVYGNDPRHASLMLSFVAEAAELHYAPYEFTAVELRNHLADLIEPSCDRDALLTLADEIERAGYNEWLYGGDFEQDEIARRIRDACGVTSDA